MKNLFFREFYVSMTGHPWIWRLYILPITEKKHWKNYREEPVDILLTDVEMPLMNGLELIGEIRKLSRRVRCLILSGYDEFEYARAALKMDVEEYILKPINEEQLDRALSRRQSIWMKWIREMQ